MDLSIRIVAAALLALLSACRDPAPDEPSKLRGFAGVLSPTSLGVPNGYTQTHFEWNEEFIAPGVANGLNVGAILQNTIVGTGTAMTSPGTTTRPGVAQQSTGTTTTGRASLATSITMVDFGSGSWTLEWTGGVEALSTSGEEFSLVVGFLDTTSSPNQTDGCYFLYDRGNVATSGPNSGNADKWSCWCVSNSTRTTFLMDGTTVSSESFTTVNAAVAALTLPSTNIQTLKVKMTGTTRAEFYVNGTKSCNINTNIPSGASRLTGAGMSVVKSAGTTARVVDVDRIQLAVDLTTARTP